MPAHALPQAQPDDVKEGHGTGGARTWGDGGAARAGASLGRHLYPLKEHFEVLAIWQEET